MYEIVAHDTALNVILIIVVVVTVLIIIGVILINRGVITVNNSNINSGVTYTGSKMACNDSIVCTNGQVCTKTDIGSMCLSPIGGVCQNLTECVNTATVCDGRCLKEEGGVGSLCETSGCAQGLECVLSDGFHRCLIPQGSDLSCSSFYDCVPNSTCFEGHCASGVPAYGTCQSSHECTGNNICLNNHCQPSDISVPGSVGAYCNVISSDCLINLACQNSPFYELPTNIGYCVKPQAIPYQACSRFIGCVPVSLCEAGVCNFQTNINSCTFDECSGGFSCDTGVCIAQSQIGCTDNIDCESGVCGSIGLVQIQSNSSGALYNWSNIFGNIPQNFDTISDIEVKDISSGVVSYSFALYTPTQFYMYSISSTGIINRTGFTFTLPGGYSLNGIKNVKIFPYDYITFHITITNGTDTWDKIIFRNDYLDFASQSNVIISLSTPEVQPYDATARNITYYTYDYVGQFLYLIVDQTLVYGFNINSTFDSQIIYTSIDSDHPLVFVVHYTSPYSFVYSKFDVLLVGWRTDLDTGVGYYLWNLTNFDLLPVQIELSSQINSPPSIGLTFGALNPVENFQMFYYSELGFFRTTFSVYNNSNNYSSTFPIPGYPSGNMSNIIQSMNYPTLGALTTSTCT